MSAGICDAYTYTCFTCLSLKRSLEGGKFWKHSYLFDIIPRYTVVAQTLWFPFNGA